MLLDAVLGLTLIIMVITVLTVAAGHQQRGAMYFGLERELVYEAEHVLTDLQQGRPASPLHEDSIVVVNALPITDESLPWVEVRVERAGQAATLYGWVPPSVRTEGVAP
ncbi:hypothetical protein ACERK3_19080 [Phycisphaerales bacterium AB-hyl4]|uniref:Uncharacterized protein n=1 Tax=Natronomicrosphaera hydrolytica TaxID=3242702 RepID=A0ABV4U9V2_9BACT